MRYKARKDLNHNEILSELEQIGFIVFDTSRLGGFVDAVVKHTAKPEIGVKMLEIKSRRGKLSKKQEELKALWKDSIIETRNIEDVLTVFGF